jgi:hypothetical protein
MRFSGACTLIALLLTGCPRDKALTSEEARAATEEAALASKAEGLTASVVELTTSFTIGEAVEAAAEELRDFIESQLPCAEVTLEDATLEVEYGVNDGNCTYRGHTFSGISRVTVTRNDDARVTVDHEWEALSNGLVELDGTAQVTWDFENETRRVVHETLWNDLDTGRTAEGEGDRTQSLLDGGLLEGIRVDGMRSWTGQAGRWDLAIDGVELRWVDPVPQAGSYTLATPFEKSMTLSFDRVDEDTIRVTVESGARSFEFNVTSRGVTER